MEPKDETVRWLPLSVPSGSQDGLSERDSVGGGEGRSRSMAAEGDRMAERRDKYFAVWTGAKVTANFSTYVRGELIIDVSRELLEQVQATAWLMRVVRR